MRGCMRSIVTSGVMALVLAAAMAAVPAHAQGRFDEYQVKAAFLFNFVKFTQWPPSDYRSDAVVIGVVGRGPFYTALEGLVKGQKLNGREVVVREVMDAEDLRTYHIILIAESEARRAADILQRVKGAGVLTVGETPYFLREGGLVRFYVEANRIRFQIDPAGAQQAGLKINSQLLSLAR